ncbi:NAD(P)-binding domain-containing protein [Lichenihabitans sp. Uapishka_5]|uniref:NAD(P)-binding domain-containing protein n=1 Tax=Lichenihabitans sp. Uapishka_5 TaxID=3037302 RepID=UPI0029E7F16A|nr:NAD(P)-binding domain-containing protein [Lichenihabitans sp. Uapishka_5]MDX7949975.1 NAD(P)-binding domain-containing protein [Lichenihabitans sp. Uapishka_5]
MGSNTGVVVIGAGPYGLSVAAHLTKAGLKPRVFGRAMDTWRAFMPNGMVLKSEGFAMNLSDPDRAYPLEAFCAERGIPYRRTGWPVPVEVFAAYGEAFQKRFVPQLEDQDVVGVARRDGGFQITLRSGASLLASQVVLAMGIRAFARPAPVLAALPADRVTHSADQGDTEWFRGQRVAVLGGGASAMDVAAALHRRGAEAVAITHRAAVRFYPPNPLRDRMLSPLTPLGPGWKKQLCVKLPDLFHILPQRLRRHLVSTYLGPAPAWSVREIVEAHTDLRLCTEVMRAGMVGGRVALTLSGPEGVEVLLVDHVIAATGYEIDIDRLAILDAPLRAALRQAGADLALSSSFETRIPGLFMVGTPAATSFGPLLRFVCGTDFAARRTAGRVMRSQAFLDCETTRRERAGAVMPLFKA